MYKFVFINGVAKVQTDDGVDVIVQPLKPTFGDAVAWESAEEAEAWIQSTYPGMIEGEIVPPTAQEETNNTDTAPSVTGE